MKDMPMTRTPLRPLALAAASALLLCACASTADRTTTAEAKPPTAVASASEQPYVKPGITQRNAENTGDLICKRQAVIGTKFKKKMCATQEQWDELAERSRTATGDIQRNGSQGVGRN